MKKILISFMIILLIFSSQVFAVEDWKKENKKREEAFEKALVELLEKYKDESIPEDERILDYRYLGFGTSSVEEEELVKVHIDFIVTPYSSENTKWDDSNNICFAEFSKVDGEYKLKWISLVPRNYDKFLEKFEEYQKNIPDNVETEIVQGEKNEDLKSGKIQEMSSIIFILSSIVLILVILSIIIKLLKKRGIFKAK